MAADELLCTPADVVNARPAFAALPAVEQTSLCNVASQKIINYCRRPGFLQSMENEYHDGTNSNTIWLRRRPVISVASIVMNGDLIDNSTGEGWKFVPDSGKLCLGPGLGDSRFTRWWQSGTQNILVQYWAGYATVPDPIQRAAIYEAIYLWERGKTSGLFTSESLGDYSYTLAPLTGLWGLPDHVLDLIVDYVQDDGPL